MTIYFKSDRNFEELFSWGNCTAVPQIDDIIEYNNHGYKVIGVSWLNPNEIHIGLHKLL